MFWKRGFITLPWTGILETTKLNFIAVRKAKSKTNMLLSLLSRSTPGGSRSDAQSIPCLLYPNFFTELLLNFVESRRAKSKTNMLLNLLSRSTPGGSRSDDQSTRCSLYPNPFHRTTACKKGTLSDFEEKWSNIPNLLFEASEIIARKKLG